MLAVEGIRRRQVHRHGHRAGASSRRPRSSAFSNPRAGGIIAMGVEEGDAVIAVHVTDGKGEIFIGTRNGMAIRFEEGDVRPMGRSAYGVRGHHPARRRLRRGDGGRAARRGSLLTRHRVRLRQAHRDRRIPRAIARRRRRHQHRDTSKRNGRVVGIAYVEDGDELLLITQQGMIIRMPDERRPRDRPRDAGRAADRARAGRQGRFGRAPG